MRWVNSAAGADSAGDSSTNVLHGPSSGEGKAEHPESLFRVNTHQIAASFAPERRHPRSGSKNHFGWKMIIKSTSTRCP